MSVQPQAAHEPSECACTDMSADCSLEFPCVHNFSYDKLIIHTSKKKHCKFFCRHSCMHCTMLAFSLSLRLYSRFSTIQQAFRLSARYFSPSERRSESKLFCGIGRLRNLRCSTSDAWVRKDYFSPVIIFSFFVHAKRVPFSELLFPDVTRLGNSFDFLR